MGFFKLSKQKVRQTFAELSKQQKEKRAFRKIVAQKRTQVARKAYAEEAEKVAIERARIKARRPSIGQILTKGVSGSIRRTVSGTKRRKSTPIKKFKPQKQRQPLNLNEALFGY